MRRRNPSIIDISPGMRKSAVPQRKPINDIVTGFITRIGGRFLLSAKKLAQGQQLIAGEIVLRYGIPFHGKEHLSIVPDLVVLDYGEMLTGESAWDFLMKSSHLYPRSDVLGYRNDGADEMVVMKHLDFDSRYAVFVYQDVNADRPICRLNAFVGAGSEALPERLCEHLPRFDSLKSWLNHA